MMFKSQIALLALTISCTSIFGCSSDSITVGDNHLAVTETGSIRLSLQVGDRNISSVTAVISRAQSSFKTQTHTIDVSGDNGVVSIFFGSLPVGREYEIELSAGDCNGSGKFDIAADVTTQLALSIVCPSSNTEPVQTGSVQVTGTIVPGAPAVCDHITKVVAAPSIQNGSGPLASVELFLNEGTSATGIVWSSSSTNGGAGVIGSLSGATDRDVTFDCSANGSVTLVAAVTAPEGGSSCTQQARVTIECLNQGTSAPVCGDGIVNGDDQCDGSAGVGSCPAGSTGSVTCSNQCIRDLSGCTTPISCGDGVVNGTEQCDGSTGVGSCPAGSTGSVSCTAQCTLDTSGCSTPITCGDGVVNGSEQCDGAVGVGSCPAGTTGTVSCTAQCTRDTSGCAAVISCGDGIVNGSEQCDGAAGVGSCPDGTTGTVSCTAQCTRDTSGCATVGGGSGVCHNVCVEDLNVNGACEFDWSLITADSDPILDCILGPTWPAPNTFPAGSCANSPLLSCYCGSLSSGACIPALPATLTGQCTTEILVGTGCDSVPAAQQGQCVSQFFTNTTTPAGRAVAYVACLQNNCPAECISP